MQRAVTAIYRSHATANLVREEAEKLGIGRGHITVLPDGADAIGTAPRTDDDAAMDHLHDLHLPDDDLRTYQQALRNGDFVVSINVDDEDLLQRLQDIMRRPDAARNLDDLDRDHAASGFSPRRDPSTGDYDQRHVGQREADQSSPHTRSYSREQPILPRNLR